MENKFAEIKVLAASSEKELRGVEGRLRQGHSSEIALYEAAVKFLKDKSADGKLPNLKTLKLEKEKLLDEKKTAKEKYQPVSFPVF